MKEFKVLISALFVLILMACGDKRADERIVSVTIEPQRYFAEKIAGDKFKINCVVPAGQSPETYDPTPQQMVQVGKSQGYLRIGSIGFEQAWMDNIRNNNPGLKVFDLSEGIDLLKRQTSPHAHYVGITPDQKYLVGIMQSALYNPDKTTKKSTMTRLVRIELATGNIEQFIYQQQSTDSDSNSGIVAIDKDTFYVIERDGELPQLNAAAIKKVYKISLAGATNLEAVTNTTDIVQDVNLGLMVGGKTLEQLTLTADGWNVLASKGIRPVSKTEYLDAVMKLNYPHDKLEGLLLFPNGTLGLINDDDFGIAAQVKDSKDFIQPKYIDKANSDIDSDRLYIYRP